MITLLLASTFAHAITPLCVPSKCRVGYLDADAHIHDPPGAGTYRVLIEVTEGSLRSSVDGVAPTVTSWAVARRYGISRAESGAIAWYIASVTVTDRDVRAGTAAYEIDVMGTGRSNEYQIYVIE